VKELGRGRGCRLRQIALFGKRHRQAPPGGIARNAAAVDPPADDEEIADRRAVVAHAPPPETMRTLVPFRASVVNFDVRLCSFFDYSNATP
jgi:hypothetical protein